MASPFSRRSRSSCSLRSGQGFFITPASTPKRFENGLLTVRYEEALESKPPIAVTVPPPTHPPTDIHPAFRIGSVETVTASSEYDGDIDDFYNKYGEARLEKSYIERKRDSGMTNIISSSSEERLSTYVTASPSSTLISENIQPFIGVRIDFDAIAHDKGETLSDIFSLDQSEFDNEGRQQINSASINIIDTEDDILSNPSLNQSPILPLSWMADNSVNHVSFHGGMDFLKNDQPQPHTDSCLQSSNDQPQPHIDSCLQSSNDHTAVEATVMSNDTERESQIIRLKYELGSINPDAENDHADDSYCNETHATSGQHQGLTGYQHELAGGIEDWKNIDGCDVDRHGFIKQTKKNLRSSSLDDNAPRYTANNSQLETEIPRRIRGINRISTALLSLQPTLNQRVSMKSFRPHTPDQASIEVAPQIQNRATGTYLLGNRHRRLVEEAGDMLQLPSKSLATSKYQEEDALADLKRKEWKRVDKWRKMAKVIKPAPGDEGMKYEFDVKSSKLINRTWKGIPDRWRAAAWYSFLRTSARKKGECPTELDIIVSFHQLLQQSSADDVQIDIDVPRTINSHIMFRTRYRGGQRLLFRVLHCLSLYFPRTGYVQGMASLAATLLCYYDEEKTFIMLVRLWTLRGMDRLYDPGFRGLLTALDEFQTKWMGNELLAKKLLRVWDIFMLLGDTETTISCGENSSEVGFPILHAISAALIDATSQTLLEGDFENVMKTLTSWIPIKDEELLMKVVRAEWKLHQKK